MREGALALILLLAPLAGCIGDTGFTGDDVEETTTEALGGFSDTHVFQGDYQTDEPYSLTLEEGPFDVLDTEALYLESEADGADIEMGIVRPDVPEGTQVPVIAFASPYLNPIHGQDLTELRPRLVENFVDHGYAIAYIAVRGTGDSGGCSNLMGPVERADLDQAVTWLGEQDWSNGNVGMLGVSYDGSTPWEVAAEGNPHLKTIVPISGVNDPYQLMFHNGSTESRGPLLLNALYYLYGFANDNVAEGRSAQHTMEGLLCPEAFEGFAAAPYAGATGERDPLGYWEERNMRPLVEENYNGSIFLVHGLQDWNVDPHHALPWVHDGLEHESNVTVKYWLGQWGHAWPDGDYLDQPDRRVDFVQTLLHWFDHWLKEDASRDLGPKVQVQDSTGQWRSDDHWPPANATRVDYQLGPDGQLTTDTGTSEGTVLVGPDSSYVFGEPIDCVTAACPAEEEQVVTTATCQGCATFETETFDEALRFAGLPLFHVNVTPTAPTGTLSAFLYEVNDTSEQRLGWTQMDLRFADGDETAEPVTPGQTVTAKMQFEPLDAVVPAGSALKVVVTAGNHADHVTASPPAPVQLHVGGQASTLTLDTFELSEDQPFTTPGEAG